MSTDEQAVTAAALVIGCWTMGVYTVGGGFGAMLGITVGMVASAAMALTGTYADDDSSEYGSA